MAENIRNRKNDGGPLTPPTHVNMDEKPKPRPKLEASSYTDENGVTYRTMPSSQE